MTVTRGLLWLVFTSLAGCKSGQLVVESPANSASPSSNAEKEETSDEQADKSAPVAGSYLTCVITKPKDQDDVTAGCQVRSKNKKRLSDAKVKNYRFGYVAPPGKDLSAFDIKQYRLSGLGKTYYFHWALRVKRKGLSLTQGGPTVLQVASSLSPVVHTEQEAILPNGPLGQSTLRAQNAKPGDEHAFSWYAILNGIAAGFTSNGQNTTYGETIPEEDAYLDTSTSYSSTYQGGPTYAESGYEPPPEVTFDNYSSTWNENTDVGLPEPELIGASCSNADDTDCDGVSDGSDQCPGTGEAEASQVDASGCVPI